MDRQLRFRPRMSRSNRTPPQVKVLTGAPMMRGTAIGFWIFSGFHVGLATSIGARILLCPTVDDAGVAPQAAVVQKPVGTPTSNDVSLAMLPSIAPRPAGLPAAPLSTDS